MKGKGCLRSFSSDSTRQLDVFRHYSHTLSVDGTKVCVLKEAYQVCLSCFLESTQSRRLKSNVILADVHEGDLSNETLEGQLSNQEFG